MVRKMGNEDAPGGDKYDVRILSSVENHTIVPQEVASFVLQSVRYLGIGSSRADISIRVQASVRRFVRFSCDELIDIWRLAQRPLFSRFSWFFSAFLLCDCKQGPGNDQGDGGRPQR